MNYDDVVVVVGGVGGGGGGNAEDTKVMIIQAIKHRPWLLRGTDWLGKQATMSRSTLCRRCPPQPNCELIFDCSLLACYFVHQLAFLSFVLGVYLLPLHSFSLFLSLSPHSLWFMPPNSIIPNQRLQRDGSGDK